MTSYALHNSWNKAKRRLAEVAEFFVLTAEQMRERMLESGAIDSDTMDHARGLLSNPSFWALAAVKSA
jgi:hypothetical protein